ncbi:MAG: hypothetical protein RJA70_2540 [Pseudomonadota bacterium]|jgi:UTP:GlnB (protein PII) uridylyltransferase
MSKINETATQFVESMPAAYRASYSEREISAHADIATRRSGELELDVFGHRDDMTGICIVADDRKGLLALISEAFFVCSMDVVEAEGFTRSLPEYPARFEAVDLFWLRRPSDNPINEEDLRQLHRVLASLLDGTWVGVPAAVRDSARPQPAPPSGGENRPLSRVRFIEDAHGALYTLEVETDDRSGLLLSLSRALTAQDVQIVRSEVKTVQRRVVDRFTITELDGSPVSDERRLAIQVAVLSAAEPARRLSTPTPPPTKNIFP